MKTLRYYREFYDAENSRYRVEILQEGSFAPQEVTLAGPPVTINWAEVDKLEPVMSSSATLRLISMTDRQFVDMYAVEVGVVRLDIYRNDALYWSGTLDTELFEEPYSMLDRYVTELTFSDFAPLSRLNWQRTGFATMRETIAECLSISGIAYGSIEEYISTKIKDSAKNLLDDAVLSMDNFYDEDGEAWSVREVLDETLRPFALRLKQKGGKITIADINALSALTPQNVEWRGSDSTLGVEPTYNKAIVTFSPYSEGLLFDGTFDHKKTLHRDSDNYTSVVVTVPGANYRGFTLNVGAKEYWDVEEQGLILGSGVRTFRIDADDDGEDIAGVMWGVAPYADRSNWIGRKPTSEWNSAVIMQTPPITISDVGVFGKNINLAVSLDVLYDVRLNPYEDASSNNEEGNWADFNDIANYGWIRAKLILEGTDGKMYSYTKDARSAETELHNGYWKEETNIDTTFGFLLEFYNQSNYKSQSGFGGWQSNKQAVGYDFGTLPANVTKHINQEKIPIPPVGGKLTLSICSAIDCRDNANVGTALSSRVTDIVRWMAYRNLKMYLVTQSGKEVDVEDVVISAWVNKAAEKEVKIDTYIGSEYNRLPMAKGIVLQSDGRYPVIKFTRAGTTDTLENLLLGTVYSNYATRKNTISGVVKLIPAEQILSDKSVVNSRYLLLSERQDLQECFSEIKMAEIVEDSYTGIEYGADI